MLGRLISDIFVVPFNILSIIPKLCYNFSLLLLLHIFVPSEPFENMQRVGNVFQ